MGQPALQFPEAPTLVSADEYLAFEREADERHEFAYGQMWAMAGAQPAHNIINYRLNQAIGPALEQRGCEGYMGDQRVKTRNRSGYLYPDAVAACQPIYDTTANPSSLLNPILIVEVTSESTAGRDHYEKFMLYRQIPSLRQYLMLDSQSIHAELYALNEQQLWALYETRDMEAVLDLSSISCQVPLAKVYGGVALEYSTL